MEVVSLHSCREGEYVIADGFCITVQLSIVAVNIIEVIVRFKTLQQRGAGEALKVVPAMCGTLSSGGIS